MGYYTRHNLTILHKDSDAIMAELRENNDDARCALDENGYCNEEVKWYDHERDLREFSKKYPDAFFSMEGSGSDAGGDFWTLHVQNGKAQLCIGEIVYPKYDPLLMK